MTAYIWKSKLDPENIMIGVKQSNDQYMAWTLLHVDGVWEIMGKELSDQLKEMPVDEPHEVEIKMVLK